MFFGLLKKAVSKPSGATVLGYNMNIIGSFDVVDSCKTCQATSIEEKQAYPKSNYAFARLYSHEND